MITKEVYLTDPCGSLSIPLWKWQRMTISKGMKILHHRDFAPMEGYLDEPYFRLYHDLRNIPEKTSDRYMVRTATAEDFSAIAAIINASYSNITMSGENVAALTKTPVYDPDLWLMAVEKDSERPVGCAIADLDHGVGEGILEWIQVLPQYRRQGVGAMMVSALLIRMKGKAAFATVSGSCANASNPEALYRSCGFSGSDVWHILKKIQPEG